MSSDFPSKVFDALGALSAVITTVIAGYAVLGAKKQLKAIDADRDAELRPYISIRYRLLKDKPEAAELQIHNSGRTSARNVQLNFPEDRTWHYVGSPNYPFLNKGVSVINPGETFHYFMGQLKNSPELSRLKDEPMRIQVRYQNGISKEFLIDEFTVSLGDQAFEIPSK